NDLGSVASSAPDRRIDRAPVPALQSRRLRRWQGFRMPDDARGGSCARWVHGAAARDRDRSVMMRLAIVRQRYTPFGGAERFIENALSALLERNVAITLYTREWPETHVQLMEPQIVDPFHMGRLWRDWSFARAVCRRI